MVGVSWFFFTAISPGTQKPETSYRLNFKRLFTHTRTPVHKVLYMTVIKSIEIFSWAKIHALFGIVFGLIYGILFAIMGAAIGAKYSLPGATTLGLLSIIVFPIIFGIMAFICGAILAFLYNVFASKIGGIEIELAEKKA